MLVMCLLTMFSEEVDAFFLLTLLFVIILRLPHGEPLDSQHLQATKDEYASRCRSRMCQGINGCILTFYSILFITKHKDLLFHYHNTILITVAFMDSLPVAFVLHHTVFPAE